jgi:hypothetical protein
MKIESFCHVTPCSVVSALAEQYCTFLVSLGGVVVAAAPLEGIMTVHNVGPVQCPTPLITVCGLNQAYCAFC